MMFPDAKHIEAHLVSEGNCFEQLAEMFCGIDCPIRDTVNGCCDKTIQTNFHKSFHVVRYKGGSWLARDLNWNALLEEPGKGRAHAEKHDNPEHGHNNGQSETARSHQ